MESVSIQCWMWESMQSWLTPTFLFLLLNLTIATIVLTSSSLSSNPAPRHHSSPSSSSLLHRLRSVTLSPFKPALPEEPHHLHAFSEQRSLHEAFDEVSTTPDASPPLPSSAHSLEAKAGTTEGDEEVDTKADDFINRFKNQLKLQRMDSIVRYKETTRRGTGAN